MFNGAKIIELVSGKLLPNFQFGKFVEPVVEDCCPARNQCAKFCASDLAQYPTASKGNWFTDLGALKLKKYLKFVIIALES